MPVNDERLNAFQCKAVADLGQGYGQRRPHLHGDELGFYYVLARTCLSEGTFRAYAARSVSSIDSLIKNIDTSPTARPRPTGLE
jgi:hypothetical protein